jgi:hypothetical protein
MKDEPTTSTLPGIRVSKELHRRIKFHALLADKTQQKYLDSIVPPMPALPQDKKGKS